MWKARHPGTIAGPCRGSCRSNAENFVQLAFDIQLRKRVYIIFEIKFSRSLSSKKVTISSCKQKLSCFSNTACSVQRGSRWTNFLDWQKIKRHIVGGSVLCSNKKDGPRDLSKYRFSLARRVSRRVQRGYRQEQDSWLWTSTTVEDRANERTPCEVPQKSLVDTHPSTCR